MITFERFEINEKDWHCSGLSCSKSLEKGSVVVGEDKGHGFCFCSLPCLLSWESSFEFSQTPAELKALFEIKEQPMNTLIQELQDNKVVYDELSLEAKLYLTKVGIANCEIRQRVGWVSASGLSHFRAHFAYRIKKDYQSEPEIEWCEVKETSGFLEFQHKGHWWKLDAAMNFPELHGFKYADGHICAYPRLTAHVCKPAEYPTHVGFVKE